MNRLKARKVFRMRDDSAEARDFYILSRFFNGFMKIIALWRGLKKLGDIQGRDSCFSPIC